MPKTKPIPEIPTDALRVMWETSGTLYMLREMLEDIERGNMPTRYDLAQMIDAVQDHYDDLDRHLPDDPDQLDLFAA